MARRIAIVFAAMLVLAGRARADDTQAHLKHLVVADDGVTMCRNLFAFVVGNGKIDTVEQPTADCWHVDFATGKVAAVPIPKPADVRWPDDPPPGAKLVPGGVSVCAADKPSECKTVPLADAATYGLVATNAARTIVAVQKTPTSEKQINIVTIEVATGRLLAKLTAYGDILQVLGETLFVQSSCAAPCGGTLYNARTGKRIAEVSDDVASANDDNNNRLTGNVWEFKETARESGEPGILLEDVTTGRHVKRIALHKLVRVDKSDNPAFQVFPVRGALLVIEIQASHRAFVGDCALVDTHGAVVERFAAPAWPRP